jgi:hypothetical protein
MWNYRADFDQICTNVVKGSQLRFWLPVLILKTTIYKYVSTVTTNRMTTGLEPITKPSGIFIVFILGLFHDAFNVSDYIV